MHVLIIPSWYPNHPGDIGGSFFREQALALHKHRCKVGVIYPQHRSLRQWAKILSGKHGIELQIDEGMPTLRYHGTNWFPRMPRLARARWMRHGWELFNEYIEQHGKPDVIHVHSILNAGILAREIHERQGIPFIITEHSSAYARQSISLSDLNVAQTAVHFAKKKFAVSNEFARLLDQIFIGDKKWQYMPNIVHERFFDKEIKAPKSDCFEFINVALVDKMKAQANILKAFANRFKNKNNIRLIIGGDGPELENLKTLAFNLGIAAQVEFAGLLTRDQVGEKMAQSSAFVLSSRYETFGVVLIEALALGKPVIATRCGGPESIVREQDGLLVPVDDVPSLAAAMQSIYENRAAYNAVEIRAACKERFSENVIAERLMQVYEEICTEH